MAEQAQPQPTPPDLRTQFVPAPTAAPVPGMPRTRLIDQDPERESAAWAAGPYLVQCNCACK